MCTIRQPKPNTSSRPPDRTRPAVDPFHPDLGKPDRTRPAVDPFHPNLAGDGFDASPVKAR